jgi:hypothetical protein
LNHYEALFAAVAASHGEKILEPLPKWSLGAIAPANEIAPF